MSDIALTTPFDERALAELPDAAGFTGELRLRAFARVRGDAGPVAGDRGVALHGSVRSSRWTSRRTRRAAGPRTSTTCRVTCWPRRERSATGPACRSSTTPTPCSRTWIRRSRARASCSPTSMRPRRRIPTWSSATCTRWCRPIARSSWRCTARSAPAGRSSTCPTGVQIELPLQTLTYLDADDAAVFPHTLIVVGANASVTFIDRYASPDLDARVLERDHRDRRRATARASGTRRSRTGGPA